MRHVLLIVCVAAGLGIIAGCDRHRAPDPSATTPAATAPEKDPAGGERSLAIVGVSDIEAMIARAKADHQVLVIDFWATWCMPCIAMLPKIHKGLEALGDGVRSVSITIDGPEQDAQARAFLRKHHALADAYRIKPTGAAQEAVVDRFGEKWRDVSVPAILVFDRKGQPAGEFLEAEMTDQVLAQVRDLLASGSSPTP